MTHDQARVELGKLFRAKPEERRVLLEAQESRRALPPGLDQRLRKFLEESWSFEARAARKTPVLGMLLIWNEVAMQATALDHTNPNPPDTPPPPYFGEQFGPPLTARVMAIMHIAMDEAVNAISPVNGELPGHPHDHPRRPLRRREAATPRPSRTSGSPARQAVMTRAIIESAYQSLASLYPRRSRSSTSPTS